MAYNQANNPFNRKTSSPLFNRTPLNRRSPLNNTEDIQWNEELFDRGDMNYNQGEWGNETQVVNPDGSITITQTRDLDRQSGGEEFVHPDGLSWGEWLQTPAGIKWNEANTGQDTRSRTIRKREPIQPISTISGEGIAEVTGDDRNLDLINTGRHYTDEDMETIKSEIEQRKKDDERSGRRRKRRRFWNNVGGAIGDVLKPIGRAGEFVLGNTGRSLVDIATTPVDLVRSIRPCRSCRKGIFDPSQMGVIGGRSGLAQGLFRKWRR